MKMLITGINGFLAYNLRNYIIDNKKANLIYTDRNNVFENQNVIVGDLLNGEFVYHLIKEQKPDVIVNTVALPNILRCEEDYDLAYNINSKTAESIAKAANNFNCRLIHISTDHLFKGDCSFYKEDDDPCPVNNYGKTKFDAEQKVLSIHPNTVVVRTNFYGWSHKNHSQTFAEWLYDSLKNKKEITLFEDFYFTPIEVSYFSEALFEVIVSEFKGIIHIAGRERCSKFEFGKAMAQEFKLSMKNIKVSKMPDKMGIVRRQKDLSLSTEKFINTFSNKLPGIKEGLKRFRKQHRI